GAVQRRRRPRVRREAPLRGRQAARRTMNVLSSPPFRAASIVWQPRRDIHVLTVVCKATFVLQPGTAEPAPEVDPIHEADEPWNDDVRCSLRAASDLAPFKARADVVLVGYAHAPAGRPVSSLMARLVVA